MINLIQIELIKIFRKWRTYIGFAAVAFVTFLIQFFYHIQGNILAKNITEKLSDSFIISGDLFNGYLIGYFVLNSLFVHIPFLIALVGGDLLASEATGGTYRMLLTRPVSRSKIILSKFIAGFIYVELLLGFLSFVSIGLSVLLFGTGDLLVVGNPFLIISSEDLLWRFFGAYILASVSMLTVFSISFMFSAFVENAIGPIVSTMAIIIIFFVISSLRLEVIELIKPYLFTTYFGDWRYFFAETINYFTLIKSVGILILHIAVIYFITNYFFNRKDILS